MSQGFYDYNGEGQYYTDPNGFGDYQYQKISDLIETFMTVYVGENKIISKADRSDVAFFAKRALQELNYDTLRSKKSIEFVVDNRLYVPMPHDFIGYTGISRIDGSGIKRPLYPARHSGNPLKTKESDNPRNPWFHAHTNINTGELEDLDYNDNIDGTPGDSTALSNFQGMGNNEIDLDSLDYNDNYYDFSVGRRYGLEPEHSQVNGSYFMDYQRGHIYFGSDIVNETVCLDYITDGLGKGEDAVIHKFAEEAFYKCVSYYIVSTGANYNPGIVQMIKKEKFAAVRNAKLRLSNYKTKELEQVIRNKSKIIKR